MTIVDLPPNNGDSYYEQRESQVAEIEKEKKSRPLIGAKVKTEYVLQGYNQDNEQVQKKIHQIGLKYELMRRVRGDGNCFMRSFAYLVMERCLTMKNECKRVINIFEKAFANLKQLKYDADILEDFKEVVVGIVKDIQKGKLKTEAELVGVFNDEMTSNYCVWFFRMVCSQHLQINKEQYQPFLLMEVRKFCQNQVEPTDKESDNIHVLAMAKEFDIVCEIVYLDTQDQFNCLIPESKSTPDISFLFLPGHYDILYRKK